jgi:anaerobic magnesium-protoporphyrin IX monomethyl ester cyclase
MVEEASAYAMLVTLTSRRWGQREELGVGYVAAAARAAGYCCGVVSVDLEAGWAELVSKLRRSRPIAVGIGFSHAATSLACVGAMMDDVRRSALETHITVGGYFATFNSEALLTMLPQLDSVVCGEGERTFVCLLDSIVGRRPLSHVKGLRIRQSIFVPRSPIEALDDLPFPVREIEGFGETDLFAVSTSRGCMAHCTFCNVPAWTRHYGGGWRGRSAENVVDEIEALVCEYGVRRFWIVDSSFEDASVPGLGRIASIARVICARGLLIRYYVFMRAETVASAAIDPVLPRLVESGLRRVFVGVESARDSCLRSMAKRANADDNIEALRKLRDCDIAVRAGWIMFTPDATLESIGQSTVHLERMSLLHSTVDLFTRLELYSGSAEINKLRRKGLLKDQYWYDPFAYQFEDPRLEPFALAMTTAKLAGEHLWDGEAMHMADLIICSARHECGVRNTPVCWDLVERAAENVNELKAIQSRANLLFMEECLQLARSGWRDCTFQALLSEHLDRFHHPTAAASRSVAKSLLQDLAAHGVKVAY